MSPFDIQIHTAVTATINGIEGAANDASSPSNAGCLSIGRFYQHPSRNL